MAKKLITSTSFAYLFWICLSFGGMFSVFLDILSHFRVHYVLIGVALGVLSILAKNNYAFKICMTGLLLNMAVMIWAMMPVQMNINHGTVNTRIYAANILYVNDDYAIIEQLKTSDYDHIFLSETDHDWVKPAEVLKHNYPYHVLQPRAHGTGMMFFSKSKFPIEKRIFRSKRQPVSLPYIWADFGDYVFIGLHASTPLRGMAKIRNEQMDMLSDMILAQPDRRFIVMGDFNDTLWSFGFQRFIRRTGLYPTAHGFLTTWPNWGLAFGIQIDHALVKGFDRVEFDIAGGNGSDHLPITLTVR